MALIATAAAALPVPADAGPKSAWAKTGRLTAARAFHTATLLPGGKVLVAGGCETYGGLIKSCMTVTASAELYNPATRIWTKTGQMKTARMGHTATLLPSGKVLVSGGCTEPNSSGFYKCTKSTSQAELYDPARGKWSTTGPMAFSRTVHSATLIPAGPPSACAPNCGKVLVVGNSLETFNGFTTVAAELYDSNSGTWAQTGTPPEQPACCFVSTALLKDQRALMINQALGSTAIFNPKDGAWAEAAADAIARGAVGVSVLKDGSVLVSGGFTQDGNGAGSPSAERFDPGVAGSGRPPSASGSWRPAARMMIGRAAQASVQLGTGNVLVVGGGLDPELLSSAQSGPSGAPGRILIKSAEQFDQRTGHWASAGEMAEGRGVTLPDDTRPNSFSATALKNGRVLVAGGETLLAFRKDRPVNLQDKGALASAEIFTPAGTQSLGAVDSRESGSLPKDKRPMLLLAGTLTLGLLGLAVAARRRKGNR